MALSAGDAAAALSAALHLPAGRFSVHCTQPDHFLIVFANSGDRDLALSRSPIPAPPYQLILRPWTRLVTATSFSMPFRVSLDLEGIPAHAWNTSTAAALVAPGRFISVDTPARPDEYRFLRVTISSHNPAAIPKTRLLLIPELTLGSQCLLRYRVLLHVRSVVCLSAPSASGDVDPAGGGGASGEGGGAANDGGGDLGARSSRGLDGGSRRDGSRRDGAPQRRSSGVLARRGLPTRRCGSQCCQRVQLWGPPFKRLHLTWCPPWRLRLWPSLLLRPFLLLTTLFLLLLLSPLAMLGRWIPC